MTTQDYYNLGPDQDGWRTLPNGNKFRIGYNATIGNKAKIGDYAEIGDGAEIGNNADIGNYAKIGDDAVIGDYAKIGENAVIDNNVTTDQLNKYFISCFPETCIFWKWVTPELKSPGWGNAKQIQYKIGEVLEVPEAIVSDQQCGVGLHVFRPGIRPEFVGCDVDHGLVCLEVEVKRKDICFGGLPGNDSKIRVKKLKVLRKINI